MRLLSLTLMLAAFSAVAFARVDPTAAPQHYNYRDASKQMRRVYYGELQETLYCGCKYDDKKNVDFNSCDFKPRENPNRKSFKRAAGRTAAARTAVRTTRHSS